MSDWKYKNKPNAVIIIKDLKHQLDYGLTHGILDTQKAGKIRDELQKAYLEEHFWKLRSINTWLQFGDRNTKFFYASAK